jgi:hypothetical protein
LGKPVSPESVAASYDAGVLTVRVTGAYGEAPGQKIAITTPKSAEELVAGEASEVTG